MILPKPVLQELGVESGAMMEVVVENGRIVATPIPSDLHTGWAEAAKSIGAAALDEEAEEWLGFANEDDNSLTW